MKSKIIKEKSSEPFSKKTINDQASIKIKKNEDKLKPKISVEKDKKNYIKKKQNKLRKSAKKMLASFIYKDPSFKDIKLEKEKDDQNASKIFSSILLNKSNNNSYTPNNNNIINYNNLNSKSSTINNKRKKIKPLNLKMFDTSNRYDYNSIDTYTRTLNNVTVSRIHDFQRPNKSEIKKKEKNKVYSPSPINNINLKTNVRNPNNKSRNHKYTSNLFHNSAFNSGNNLTSFQLLNSTCKKDRTIYKTKHKSIITNLKYKNINKKSISNVNSPVNKRKNRTINKNKPKKVSISEKYKINYIIKIQANFRRYILKKRLYNNIKLYMRYIQAIFVLSKVYLSNMKYFMKKLKNIIDKENRIKCFTLEYYNNINNELNSKMQKIIERKKELELEHIDKMCKMYKDKYNNVVKEKKKMMNINHIMARRNIELMKKCFVLCILY